jgi:LytS/YehU family sensor histidine kinase
MDALFRSSAEVSEGMGIGLHYVVQSIRMGYGGRAALTVESTQNEGTVLALRLPKEMEEEYAERTDRR